MAKMRRARAWVGCLLFAFPVQADQTSVFESTWVEIGRWVELPQHKKLFRLLQDPAVTLAPFATDGCSGGMSAAWQPVAQIIPGFAQNYAQAPPWESCCVTHDMAYHNVGKTQSAPESFDARLKADETLMQCVLQDGIERRDAIASEFSTSSKIVDQAYDLIANGMFQAVRLGGGPCSGLSWRWGYGYPSCLWQK